ncbi:type II and III secretion system protein family protein [Erythrobacter sp. BLCC-B19]|uniref:type II and III secretion system protein family protein n=1 Tax=Erythrobacter sp. BLCC-B19 TaxID=3025315 RepID=UPI00235F700F|nr:type II and III secretion system protein family protein [Erythrobacter sp. BLCC-B19]WDA39898.1 type II and III secretion system protein family protein [Erythrobacter sp. BLCC-B19]
MTPKFKIKLLVAALAATPMAAMPAATATAQQVVRPSQEIVLSIGKGELVTVPGTMADVFVANEAVADVQVKSQRQLYLFGKAGGETTVYASNERGDVIFSANVRVGSNIGSIDQMLAMAMPDAKVSVSTMGTNTVLLTGTVSAPEDAAEAERLVNAFLGTGTNVISRLKTATPLQVNLQVKFAEVSRSLVREIGANLTSADSTNGFQIGIGTGRGAVVQYNPGGPVGTNVTEGGDGTSVISTTGGTTLAGLGRLFGVDLAGTLDLSERLGLVTTISEPNLTALSGETATFLAGGEFPIPIAQGLGQVTVQFRQFGVSLAYTPTVLSNGRISMRVRPEVSELSTQGAITLNGFQVPAITTRRTETTIELGSGQSFMIAGLMSANSQNQLEKAPGLGDVPILGNLFRSRQFRKGETELVIIVTPYLVKPVDAKDIKLPTDGYRSANEFQQLLGYQNNAGISGEARPGPTAADQEAPAPKVSDAGSDDAIAPTSPEKPRRAEKKSRKGDRSAAAGATPGFSL